MATTDPMTDEQSEPPIFNKTIAIELAGGKQALAEELMGMLLERLAEDKALIKQSFNAKDTDQFHHHVHKLHGAACYCGTPKLKQVSHDLETAIKLKDDDQIAALYQDLLDVIDQLIALDKDTLFM